MNLRSFLSFGWKRIIFHIFRFVKLNTGRKRIEGQEQAVNPGTE